MVQHARGETETDTPGSRPAGGALAAALAAFWKGSLVLLGCAIILGRFSGSPGISGSAESSPYSFPQVTLEDDGTFAELQLRALGRDALSHIVVKNPAGKRIAMLSYDHRADELKFVRAELGSVRSDFWKRPGQGVSCRLQDTRAMAETDLGLDHSVAMTVRDAWMLQRVLDELRVPAPPPHPEAAGPSRAIDARQ